MSRVVSLELVLLQEITHDAVVGLSTPVIARVLCPNAPEWRVEDTLGDLHRASQIGRRTPA